jgi:antitoxin ParD1/3/4
MNVSLTPELEKYIQEKVACGLYSSSSEVIRESLRLMHAYDDLQKQRLAQFTQLLDEGMDQINKKQTVSGQESRKKMHAKLNKMARTKK